MRLAGVFTRFTLYYFLSTIVISVLIVMFHMKANFISGLTKYPILWLSTRLACDAYIKRYQIFFTKREMFLVIAGFTCINVIIGFAGLYVALGGRLFMLTGPAVSFLIIDKGLIDAAFVFFTVWLCGRTFSRQKTLDDIHNKITVFSTSLMPEAQIITDLLEPHGIQCNIVNEGQPFNVSTGFSVLISDISRLDEARVLIEEYERSIPQPSEKDWVCSSCGESSEGQFTACWNCGRIKH